MKGWSLVWHYVMDNTHWHMTGLGSIIMCISYHNIIFPTLSHSACGDYPLTKLWVKAPE